MPGHHPNAQTIPLGVVVRRTPGVTRWAKYAWQVSAVLPGAADADWKVLRTEGDVTEFHAAMVGHGVVAGDHAGSEAQLYALLRGDGAE